MGQEYLFRNITKKVNSDVPVCTNMGLPWGYKLDTMDKSELAETFKQVICFNGWSDEDNVVAIGEYGDDIYYWQDVKDELVNTEKWTATPEEYMKTIPPMIMSIYRMGLENWEKKKQSYKYDGKNEEDDYSSDEDSSDEDW